MLESVRNVLVGGGLSVCVFSVSHYSLPLNISQHPFGLLLSLSVIKIAAMQTLAEAQWTYGKLIQIPRNTTARLHVMLIRCFPRTKLKMYIFLHRFSHLFFQFSFAFNILDFL
ncbi:hypothetical protein XENORESO_003566 [Xenotaenia resolanae]|uniref:Uncharacterized protein n=1 Tax=Xenotaenia resolanae TaxID=208358 RepID=A0ABV0W5M6_9TELE